VVLSSAWAILGIEQTSDLRAIKRAYSKLLKQNRPDEKPAEFQRLHQAYKAALVQARWLTDQSSTEDSEDDLDTNHQYNFTNSSTDNIQAEDNLQLIHNEPIQTFELNHSNQTYSYQEQQEYPAIPDYQIEIDRILNSIETIIDERRGYEKNSWRVLLESEYILDQDFIDQLGLALLRRIAKYFNEEEFRVQGDFAIDADILRHLNSIFRWDQYEYDFNFYLTSKHGICQFNKLSDFDEKANDKQHDITSDLRGAKSIKKVFRANDFPFKQYYYAGDAKRIFAMFFDLAFLAYIMLQINVFSEIILDYSLAGITNYYQITISASYLIGTWLFESSRYQATPGKLLFGLRVINKNQGRIGYFHGLFRCTTFALTCFGIVFTALINSWSNGKYIHDRITRSYVMDLTRTRKEQL
jgi:uncharacterized RDD family membrane protein YckC